MVISLSFSSYLNHHIYFIFVIIVDNSISVFTRTQTLLSFVLAGYVTLCIQRWDKIRNDYFGKLWGSLENLVLISCDLIPGNTPLELKLKNKLLRYARLNMRLLFYAARGTDDLSILLTPAHGSLITPSEIEWLSAIAIGTRPLTVIIWMRELVYKMVQIDSRGKYSFAIESAINEAVSGMRGGVGGTLGLIGCPYPFIYVHAINWIVQISLVILAIETGCTLSILLDRKLEGYKHTV